MVGSKENYKFDLGVKRLTDSESKQAYQWEGYLNISLN